MANALIKALEMAFEPLIDGFDAECVMSKAVPTTYPDAQNMQRAQDIFYRNQEYQARIVTGLDVSAATRTDVIQRMVPTVFRSPDNVVYELSVDELRDPMHMQQMGKAAATSLAGEIDNNLLNEVATKGTMTIKKVGAFDWTDGATAEAALIKRGAGGKRMKLFMNATDYLAVSKDLGNRAYMVDWSKGAYERSQVPNIANFETFRTDLLYNQTVTGTVSGTTVTSNTAHTVTAMTGDLPTDNRFGALPVSGANIANIKNGDHFTIAGVNACHSITKTDTGDLMTFRVISGGGTASLTISPKIITSGPYQNVTAQAAAAAAITFLNTATKPVNPFFTDGSVALDFGTFNFVKGAGAEVLTAKTKQGVPIAMIAQINAQTGKLFVRSTTKYAVTMLCPDQGGLIIANQV